MKIKKEIIFQLLCFNCTDKIHNYEELKNHTKKNHNIFIDLNEITIICIAKNIYSNNFRKISNMSKIFNKRRNS